MGPAVTYRLIRVVFSAILILQTFTLRAQTPVASFSSDKTTGCAPLMVNFTNTSTGATSYQWNFGNSNTSTAPNPSTVFLTPGTYTVKLIAIGAGGVKDSITHTINVVNDPIAAFTASPLSACEDVNVITFTNSSSNAATYTWDFGDGSSSTLANPTHTYIDPGVYNVKLIATSTYGCQNIEIKSSYITINAQPQAQFAANTTSACDINTVFNFSASTPGITSWFWDLGDGQTSTQQNPSHQYSNAGNYNVSLIVTNANGCSDTLSRPNYINIGSTLVPSFTMSDTAGCNPLPINFNCTVPNATSWSWNFGDGTTATNQNPSHTYTVPGSYSITLTVTTQSGCNGTVTVPNFVVVDQLPIPNFSVVRDSGCAPYTPQMINLSTGASTYNWAFGNGASSTATNGTTTFTQGGYFSVTLTAISPNGCPASLTKVQYIKVFAPGAGFQGTPKIGCPGMTVQFTNTSAQTNLVSYFWTFGDGTTSTLQNPSHTYNSIGNFPVSLVVQNSFGCRDTVYRANYITVVSPITNYTVPDTVKICLGDPHVFVDPTTGSNLWNWNFGDGGTSHTQNPSHTYNTLGNFTVTLNTSMAGGCTQNFNPYAYVLVIPYVKKPINMNLAGPCKPYTVNFSTATTNVVSYTWSFGDGATSTLAAPTHIYQNAGTYNVSLTLVVGQGCITQVDTTITLGHTNPTQVSTYSECVNNNLLFSVTDSLPFVSAVWHFADGTTAPYFKYWHAYTTENTYAPYLVTIDLAGCRDTFFTAQSIAINDPNPTFSVANTNVCLGSSVTFHNGSNGGDLFFWDFGDGTTSSDSVPVHTYANAGTFTVSLTVTKGTCTKTKTITGYITVIDPIAHLTYTTNGMCMPVTVSFTSIAPTAVQWTWLFGNGDSSNLQNPVYTYYNTPSDSLSLTIMDANGCYKTVKEQNIDYYNASMSVDQSSGCTPLTVQFTDISNGALTWAWDFGDGNTSTLQNPSHTYTTNGIYDVRMICTFPGGCTDTTIYNDYITAQTPTSDFFSPSVAGCSPTQINFTNTSTDATIFEWNFGDGGTSTSVNPSHIYYIPGYYDIRLVATNSLGCKDTMIKPSYIFIPGTYSNFSVSATQGCQNLLTAFTDSSINATSWSWNFGDGYIDSIQNPIHMYQDTGTYIVTLITRDTLGCSSSYTYPTPIRIFQNPVSSATATSMGGCSDFTTSFVNHSLYADTYYWEFGTGDTSTLSDPSYTYTSGGNYYPILVSITNNGCRDTFNFNNPINVLQTPTAVIGLSDTSACNPATITFTSNSLNTIGANYDWTFGNGNTSTGMITGESYTTPGNYTATLITTNSNGCSDTTSANLTILVSPTADANSDVTEGCHPFNVNFFNLSTGGSNYLWQFGNGDSSTAFEPNYVYQTPGVYYPYLVTYNSLGCTDTVYLPAITVHHTPVAIITTANTTGCNPSVFNFTNSSLQLENPVYSWSMGDGSTFSSTDVSYDYTLSGTFTVTLLVTNTFGCYHDTSLQVIVHPTPTAASTSSTINGCSELSVQFSNTSIGADTYLWNFGDGNTDTAAVPSNTYLVGGVYTPQLIAMTQFGCSDTLNMPAITVLQSPTADFYSNDTMACKGSIVTFYNTSTNLISPTYNWNLATSTNVSFNPVTSYVYSGDYDISLVVTNSNGCTDTMTKVAYINVADSLPPPADPILSVSVVDDSSVDITWQNSSVSDLKYYEVYRLNASTNNYDLIYHDANAKNSTAALTSTYRDTALDTRHNTYTYKVLTIDYCDNKLPLSALNPHTTIDITALQAGVNIFVRWTPYVGCSVNTYDLYRTEVASGLTQFVVSVPATQLNYLDTSLSCPFDYSYKVTATDLCGNTYISNSDTSVARPLNILANQQVSVIRSTVIDNKDVLTEWLPPAIHPERVLEYQIYRSEDNSTFNLVAIVPAALTSYTDMNASINEQEYYYRILVVNDCNLSGIESNRGSSILLTGSHGNYSTEFNWTPYKEWQPGVDTYQLERINAHGVWEIIKVVDGTVTNTTIDE